MKYCKDLRTLGIMALMTAFLLTHAINGHAAAFPAAQGYGADITGGRGGQVIHVTNLNPSGTGSLQAALSTSGPRIIVFDVSGVITAEEILITHGDFTLAGETAPGGGITLNAKLNSSYLDFSVTNFIIRHLRIRPTHLSGDQGDAIRIANNSDFILDHISTSWGSDETIDAYQSHDFTIQWSTIEESATYFIEDLYYNGFASDPWNWVRFFPESISPEPSKASSRIETPGIAIPIAIHDSTAAYDLVMAQAGAWPRDTVTLRTIDEVQNGTGSWGRNVPTDLMAGLMPTDALRDTDRDGMPDEWERDRGLDPSVPDDDADDDGDGYTNIEEYLHYRSDILIGGRDETTPSTPINLWAR